VLTGLTSYGKKFLSTKVDFIPESAF
jgi:hypothetical protein